VRCRSLSETAPLRLAGPSVDCHGLAVFHLLNTSAAVIGGDTLDIRITVESGVAAAIRTPGATLIHPGGSVRLHERLHVATGGYLEWTPGALIPHTEANLAQRFAATVDEGGTLVVAELMLAGRIARGEAFAFEQLRLTRSIICAGRPLFVEVQRLQPQHGRLASWGPFLCQASLLIAGPVATPALAGRLAAIAGDVAGSRDGDEDLPPEAPVPGANAVTWGSASTLAGTGVLFRLLSRDVVAARRLLAAALCEVRNGVLGRRGEEGDTDGSHRVHP